MTSPTVRVTCAVIIREGKVFAARRGRHSSQPLQWEFPGGKLEPGESDEACLHRELTEELDLKVSIVSRLPEFTHSYPESTIVLVPFLCRLKQCNLRAREHHETAWFTAPELSALDWSRADIPVMEYVVKEYL